MGGGPSCSSATPDECDCPMNEWYYSRKPVEGSCCSEQGLGNVCCYDEVYDDSSDFATSYMEYTTCTKTTTRAPRDGRSIDVSEEATPASTTQPVVTTTTTVPPVSNEAVTTEPSTTPSVTASSNTTPSVTEPSTTTSSIYPLIEQGGSENNIDTGLGDGILGIVVAGSILLILFVVLCALIQYRYRASSGRTPPKFIRCMLLNCMNKRKNDQQPPREYAADTAEAPLYERDGGNPYQKKRDFMASTRYSDMHGFSGFGYTTRTDLKSAASTAPNTTPKLPPPQEQEVKAATKRTLRKIPETEYFKRLAAVQELGLETRRK